MLLTPAELAEISQSLPEWSSDGRSIRRTFRSPGFVAAVDFINRLVGPAEAAHHHPDVTLSYDTVTVTLTTHDLGGLTQKDIDLARVISRLRD